MDMDIPKLAAETAALLAPFLPYLIKGGKIAAKAAFEEAGKKFTETTWNKAEEVWKKIWDKAKKKEAAKEAIEDAANHPTEEDAQAAFRRQLTKLIESDEKLFKFIMENVTFENMVNTGGNVENSTIIAGKDNTVINAQTYIQGNVYNGPAPRNPQDALKVYRAVMANMTSSLSMRGIDLRASDPNTQRTIGLANVYIDLDTRAADVNAKGNKEKEITGDGIVLSTTARSFEIRSVLDAVIENRNLVIKGDPGSGKSTFVNYLTYCLSTQTTDRLKNWEKKDADLLPVIVILRDFVRVLKKLPEHAEPRHIWEFIEKRLKDQNLSASSKPIHELLEQGKAIVFLDGLDEVSTTAQRVFVRDAVHAFVKRFPKNRFVVTCRILSYTPPKSESEPDLRLTTFPEFELAPFDDEKINSFIDHWYGELTNLGIVTKEFGNDLHAGLKSAVRRVELRKLASNPLLLTVMAVVNTHKGRLPDARALLYEQTVEILLWQWEQTSKERKTGLLELLLETECSPRDFEQVIWKLAYEAHAQTDVNNEDEESLAGISELKLQKSLAALNKNNLNWAAGVIEAMKLRAGLLLERDNNVFTFPHRSFQEFLAGTYLDSKDDFVPRAKELAKDQLLWRQTILWAVSRRVHIRSSIDGPLMLVAELCPTRGPKDDKDWSNVWLAGDILLEIGLNRVERADSELGKELLPRVQNRLKELVEGSHLTPRERAEAGDTLAKLGDPRIGVTNDFLFCEIPAGVFKMGDEGSQLEYDKIKSNYFMSRYPITNAQYDLFLNDPQGYRNNTWWTKAGLDWRKDRTSSPKQGGAFDLPNHPVVNVTWYEAAAFCKWLTAHISNHKLQVYDPATRAIRFDDNLKLSIVNRKFEIRLPTEAEWERAARGGKNYRYPWNSDEITPNHANYSDTNLNVTSAVGAFPLGMNDYGLLDMSGNVWEWCATEWQDNYQEYMKKENNKPEGYVARVVRGGAYDYEVRNLRCASRGRLNPYDEWNGQGFRVVASFPISLLRSGS